jgi:hypothetical protein
MSVPRFKDEDFLPRSQSVATEPRIDHGNYVLIEVLPDGIVAGLRSAEGTELLSRSAPCCVNCAVGKLIFAAACENLVENGEELKVVYLNKGDHDG